MTEVETFVDPGDAVGVYVHWPYCARICPYCDFNVVRDRDRVDEKTALFEAILTDLDRQANTVGPRRLASVFLGGGTPSLMSPDQVAALIDRIKSCFVASGPAEITLEANPTDAEADHFAALASAGVNRLSLGVQSLHDDALTFLGRNHSAAEARRAIDLAARAFSRLSIDLIHALPGQTVAEWTTALSQAVDLGFEHISPYQLTWEADTAFGRALARGQMQPVDEDTAADLYEATQTVLSRCGFSAYEVSNHARGAQARSVHNLHVWRGGDYLGLGPGAHGRLTLAGQRQATVAHRKITDYIAGVNSDRAWADHTLFNATETAEERILLGLRTVEGISPLDLATLGFEDRANDLINQGLMETANGRFRASEKGRPVLDSVLRLLLT